MDFRHDPYLNLYLPLHQLDGLSFGSRDVYGHLVTVTGALWTPQGRQFDGTDDWIDCGDNDLFSMISADQIDIPFSGFAWVKLTDATQSCIFGKRASGTVLEWIFEAGDASDKLNFGIFKNGDTLNRINAVSDIALTADQGNWIYVGFSYDGSETTGGITLYRNGLVFASTNTQTGTYTGMSNTASKMGIGALNDGAADLFDGVIRECGLWRNKALTAVEHLNIYLATKEGKN